MFLSSLASLTLVALWLPRVLRPCSDVATSCSNTSRRQITSCERRLVAASRGSDKSLRVYGRVFVKIFVSATGFCSRNKAHKFCLIWFSVTCCGDKIMLQRRRFSQNSSSRHEAICTEHSVMQISCSIFPFSTFFSPLSFYPDFFLDFFARLLSPLITYIILTNFEILKNSRNLIPFSKTKQ